MAAGAVSLRKSYDIVILSFCNKVKGQANYVYGITKTLCSSSVVGRLATFIVRKTRWRQHWQKKISPFLHGEVKLKTIFGGVSTDVLQVCSVCNWLHYNTCTT